MNLISSREQAYTTLFALISSLSGIKMCTRRLQIWQQVPAEDQPAIYMEHTGEITQPSRGQPSKIVLEVNLWVYVHSEGNPVGPVLNPVLDTITTALTPRIDGDLALTLGGLVHHCWIEGQTQIFEGDLGEEAVAIVPVKLLVT